MLPHGRARSIDREARLAAKLPIATKPDEASPLTVRVNPTSRRHPLREGGAQATIGWVAALLLHASLLAALLVWQPMRLPPAPNPPAISLLLQPRSEPAAAATTPVRPRPPEMPAQASAVPTVIISATRPAMKPSLPKARVAPASRAAPAVRAGGESVQQALAPAAQVFVAATPLAGNVNQPPEYPPAALAHGEQGRVLLSIHVLPDGRTDFVSVTQSSGYRILDQAAHDAVMGWVFQPASLAGKSVVMVIPYWINFDLQRQHAQPQQAQPGQ